MKRRFTRSRSSRFCASRRPEERSRRSPGVRDLGSELLPLEGQVRRHGGSGRAPAACARGGERKAQAASGRGASGQRGAEDGSAEVVRPAGKRAVNAPGRGARSVRAPRRRLAGLNLSTWQYRARRQERSALRERLKELASQRRRLCYRRLHALLRREGWRINHKAVHRMYVEEGLQVRQCKRKRRPGSSASPC